MNYLTIEDIRRSEIGSLLILRDYCKKNKLKYYLTYGSLLGAIRHKGFIPWDDDIDVFMPRLDYDYLIEHFNDDTVSSRRVISREISPQYYLDFAKIIDGDTVMIEKGQTLKIGVWIDIFPMEYIKDKGVSLSDSISIRILSQLLIWARLKPDKGRALYKNIIIRIFNMLFPFEKGLKLRRDAYLNRIKAGEKSRTYGLMYRNFGRYGVPVFSETMFEPSLKKEFEGEEFDIPQEYDTMLRWFYGKDYMTLPPVQQQKSNHSYICYWKESV